MNHSTALRLYGKQDFRLETFELGEIRDDEILAEVQTDSICMSTLKAYNQGAAHKRVPDDVATNPVIVGHEFAGSILQVGSKYQHKFAPGMKFGIQPAMYYPGREFEAPGYSFHKLGGDATRVIVPREVLEMDCLLPFDGEGYFNASLAEPYSCVIGACNAQYHYKQGTYVHEMGPVKRGAMLVHGGTGPMGLAFIDYALHGPYNPKVLVITGRTRARLERAERLFTVEHAATLGTKLVYAAADELSKEDLMQLTAGRGFEDAFVFAAVDTLVEQAAQVLAFNGCLNFFAGPADKTFSARLNFFDVHYHEHHVACNSGGNLEDMRDSLRLMAEGKITPAVLISQIGGLNVAGDTVARLPELGGAKKMIYTHLDLPLINLEDLPALASESPLYAKLAECVARHDGLWSVEAENILLAEAPRHNVPLKA